jgi:hypothetical protein
MKTQYFATHAQTHRLLATISEGLLLRARKVSQLPGARALADTAIVDYIWHVFAVETEIETLRAQYEQRTSVGSVAHRPAPFPAPTT